MAQPQIATGELPNPTSSQASTPAVQGDESERLTETPDNGSSSTETPKPLIKSPDQTPNFNAFVPTTPASTEAVSLKVTPEDGTASVALASSSNRMPESSGSVLKTIDLSPAEKSSLATEPAPSPAETAGFPQLPITSQIGNTVPVAFAPVDPVDGTGGALSSQRMKFASDKNEIAGPVAQKVPVTSSKDALSSRAANDLVMGPDSDHSGHKQESLDSAVVMDWPAKSSEWSVDLGNAGHGTWAAQSLDHAAAQADRMGQLLNQQVVVMHQSGANNLAVSLKLDPRTELSLQLTKHNGEIQASVRVERGDVAGLGSHWKDLQESLARQNVQLLPLESKAAPRTPVFNSSSGAMSESSFNQSSPNPEAHSRGTRQNLPQASDVKSVPVSKKATAPTVSRQGWESWA